jgi:2-iminobutanoate/2-iminopropanoate deaminase
MTDRSKTQAEGRRKIHTDGAPKAIGPYSQAIRSGNLLFCSGQVALDPETGEFHAGTAAEEARHVLDNLRAVVEAGGSTLAQVVRCTVFLVDMADFASVNQVYGEYFTGDAPPARATVAVAQLPKGARVEIDAIAVCG